ncbi:MAG: alpha/beta hydrolase [Candidatus Zixiibacteriota bacterium]
MLHDLKLLIVIFLIFLPGIIYCQQIDTDIIQLISEKSSKDRIDELLNCPSCLKNNSDSAKQYTVENVIFPSGDILLNGELYLPVGSGPFPGIVFMHGGGNNYEMLYTSVMYDARRFAKCGYVALIYDKRGMGKSGGVFHESTYNDYVNDAGNAAEFLKNHKKADPNRIGVIGGSQGGRLAPVVAVRFPFISFVISQSGPIGPIIDHCNYNIEYALKIRGYEDSTIEQVMPIWKKQHQAWKLQDSLKFAEVADEILLARESIDPMALPNTREEFYTDSNLFFLRPTYNSIQYDFFDELTELNSPWLSVYGELDSIISVPESISNLQRQMKIANNKDYEIVIYKNVGHSFQYLDTGEFAPEINIVINWLGELFNN